MAKVKKRKQNTGSVALLSRKEWCEAEKIQGTDLDVLHSPVMNKAFERILETYKPKHKIAFCSLCTQTRPYSKSIKWKRLIKLFINKADLIITSNGGIIPIIYETCYPYMTYDAHGEAENNAEYIKIMVERMKRFFSTIKYDYIVFNYRPKLRNVTAAQEAGQWLVDNGHIKGFAILPTPELYEEVRAAGKLKSMVYSFNPELEPTLLNQVVERVDQFRSDQ